MAANGEGSSNSEVAELRLKVKSLEKKLRTCENELHKLHKKLNKMEQRYKTAEKCSDLRKQVNKLSAEIHERKKREKNRTNAETQTDEDSSRKELDYGGYYQSGTLAPELHRDSRYTVPDSLDTGEMYQVLTQCVPDSSSVPPEGETATTPGTCMETNSSSIADMIRATAEEAVSQTGFVFDETSGMYYDHNTGFYYDSTSQLYYDANTGIYYYYDTESGRYQFHSRVEVQSYKGTVESGHDKKVPKRRKSKEQTSVKDKRQTLRAEAEVSDEHRSERLTRKQRRAALRSCSPRPSEDVEEARDTREAPRAAQPSDSSTESEPEEGEIRESDGERDPGPELSSATGSESGEEGMEASEEVWPPCVRVTVIRSPVLDTGTLFIITADAPTTIGREKHMDHAIEIPEPGVSKFHAEVYFDQESQSYVLVDRGSTNGTVVNGNRILNPKAKSEPCVLAHGDEVKMGDTVLSFHVHPGNETCDGCEPGQVLAHVSRHRRDEAGGSALSKEDKETLRQKELKQMKVKYGLTNSEYEEAKVLKNPRYKDRAEERRQVVGSEGTFYRDDAPASVHVEIDDKNKGRRMLEKMGWKRGEGLGKDRAGRKDPIQLQIRKPQAGLGAGTAVSVDNVGLPGSKKHKNWEKARLRFADTCREPGASSKKD